MSNIYYNPNNYHFVVSAEMLTFFIYKKFSEGIFMTNLEIFKNEDYGTQVPNSPQDCLITQGLIQTHRSFYFFKRVKVCNPLTIFRE